MVHSQIKNIKANLVEKYRVLMSVNAIVRDIDPIILYSTLVNAVIDGVSSLGRFAVLGVIFQQIINGYLSSRDTMTIQFVVVVVFLVSLWGLLKDGFFHFGRFKKSIFEEKLRHFLERKGIEKILSLDIGRILQPEFIALKEKVERRGYDAILRLFRIQVEFVSACVGVVTALTVLFALGHPFLILLAITPVIPYGIKMYVMEQKHRMRWENDHITRRKKWEYEESLTDKQKIVQVKSFKFTQYLWNQYNYFAEELIKNEFQMEYMEYISRWIMSAIEVGSFAIVMLYLGSGLVDGTVSFPTLFLFFGTVKTFNYAGYELSQVFVSIDSKARDYAYYEEFMQVTALIDERGAHNYVFIQTPTLTLADVSFQYPQQDTGYALHRCSLVIKPHERVVIVGKNGSGKTTIARLLAKIYLPETGTVLIDTVQTHNIRQESLCNHILYVTQDCGVHNFQIDEALAGMPSADVDTDRLHTVAQVSGADEFVLKLKHRYQTQIGEHWPGGVGFSSGQMQRLMLTSALYRLLDPSVHVGIFDEPMSNCDIETRERFYHSLSCLQQKTIVVIAHDPLYLHHFERVLVVDEGRVVEDICGNEAVCAYQKTLLHDLSE